MFLIALFFDYQSNSSAFQLISNTQATGCLWQGFQSYD
jgi:hypothetical protein